VISATTTGCAPAPAPPPAWRGGGERVFGFGRHLRYRRQVLIAGDVLAAGAAAAVAMELRRVLRDPAPFATVNWLSYAAAVLAFVAWDLLESRRANRISPAYASGLAFLTASLVCATALFYYRAAGIIVSRLTMLLFTALGVLAEAGWHALARRNQDAAIPADLILVGDEAGCGELAAVLEGVSGLRVKYQCWLSNTIACEEQVGNVESILRSEVIDEVLLVPSGPSMDAATGGAYGAIIELCEQTNTKFHIYSRWLRGYPRARIDHLGEIPVLSYSFAPDAYWSSLTKRWIDVAVAAALLLATSPLLALAACGILLETGRPVLFRQTRCGLRGRPFQLLKLRTMTRGAESQIAALAHRNEMSGPVFKMRNDPRITGFGKWLRRSSVDELPQLLNVLRGEMSLVGPRPPTPEEVHQYCLGDRRRLATKPGITGLWQVSGRNRITNFRHWVELDNQYIRNWSLRGDLRILIQTVWVVLRMSGS
jgi:exopolysaccharide biosynthesis polyprenyl glycosylphosphotransferase